ncbi:hypothetical protein [Alkalibacillus silvisoli]|uniref:Uncharacterized protein n=1 Tax=Alkalibacillus silvisoli TaxID=392823 RepID=A0ABN0ZLI9_9BACI
MEHTQNDIAKIIKIIGYAIFLIGVIIGSVVMIDHALTGLLIILQAFITGMLFIGFAEVIRLLHTMNEKISHSIGEQDPTNESNQPLRSWVSEVKKENEKED